MIKSKMKIRIKTRIKSKIKSRIDPTLNPSLALNHLPTPNLHLNLAPSVISVPSTALSAW